MRRIRLAALLLAGSAGLPGAASAQDGGEGPVTQLNLSTTLRAESNVARADEVRAGQRGLTQADQRATIGAELVVSRPLGRNTLDLSAFAGYDLYRRNTALNRERLALDATMGLNVGPCLVTLSPQFERGQSEISSIAVVAVPGIESVRNTQTIQDYQADLRCGRPTGLRPMIRGGYSRGDNDNIRRQVSDYESQNFAVGLSYSNPILGRYDLLAGRQWLDHPNRISSLSGLSGYRLDEVRLSAVRDIGAIVTADASVAYTQLEPEDSTVEGFTGLAWSLGTTVRPTPRLEVQALYAQLLSPSLGADAVYSRTQELSIGGTYAITSRTSLSLSGRRSTRDFEGAMGTFGPVLLHDQFDQVIGELQFNVSPRIQLAANGGHEERDANGDFFDYKNAFATLNATFTIGTP